MPINHLFSLINRYIVRLGSLNLLEIDLVINILKNGEWHELSKIFEKCNLSEVKVEIILKFLVEYGFIETDGCGRKVKVSPSLQKFLEETQL